MHIHHAVGVTEADWIRWVGVITAIVGSVVAAPSGGLLIVRQVAAAVWIGFQWLANHRPFRRHAGATPRTASGQATIPLRFNVQAEGLVGPGPETSTGEQLQMLWKEVTRLHGKINQVSQDAQQRLSDLASRLDSATADLQAAHQAMSRQWEEEQHRSVHIDARGLPLIGLGILMTGFPDGLAVWAWFGWLVTAVAVTLMLWLAVLPLSQAVIRWYQARGVRLESGRA